MYNFTTSTKKQTSSPLIKSKSPKRPYKKLSSYNVDVKKTDDAINLKGIVNNSPGLKKSNLLSPVSPITNKGLLNIDKFLNVNNNNSKKKNSCINLQQATITAGCYSNSETKENQDAYTIFSNFCKEKDCGFFAVCDGHGAQGHLVSNFVKQNLANNIEKIYETLTKEISIEISLRKALKEGFLKTSKDLKNCVDSEFSGTTCCSVTIPNVGDSRAVLGKYIENKNKWESEALTRDQKPDDPIEEKRILDNGGRIAPFIDENGKPSGPPRIWLKNENIPGLAVARSIGDTIASKIGVTAEPDKLIVIASDGVWEFLSNDEVINLISPYYNKNDVDGACAKLISESTKRWKKEDTSIDDITCIVVFIQS